MSTFNFTDSQRIAINEDGLTVLIACPGAGKTTVIGQRCNRLSFDLSGDVGGFAAITFTNAAANEIQLSYERATCSPLEHPNFVGTIDAFIIRFLFFPFGHLVLGDKDGSARIVFPESSLLRYLYRGKKFAKLHGVNPMEYTYNREGDYNLSLKQDVALRHAIITMKKDMFKRNLATIPDAMYWSLKVLREYPRIMEIFCNRFKNIMIDEAQDCSDVQMAIVDELVAFGHKNIMLVGDPMQALYEWRDAKPVLINEKLNQVSQGWKPLSLRESQRCSKNIVKILNNLAKSEENVYDELQSVVEEYDGKVEFIDSNDPTHITSEFSKYCGNSDITVSTESAVILFGSYSSIMSPIKVSDTNILRMFPVASRENLALFALVQRQMLIGNYSLAFQICTNVAYVIKHKMRREEYIFKYDVEDRAILLMKPKFWAICKRLPLHDMLIFDWITYVNQLIVEFIIELGVDFEEELHLGKGKSHYGTCHIFDLLVGNLEQQYDFDFQYSTIHNAKGKSFEAVLLYIESGNHARICEGRILKMLTGKRPVSKFTESERCVYVAVSRAKKLLCLAGHVSKIRAALSMQSLL